MELILPDKLGENEAIFPTFNETGAETFPMTSARPFAVFEKRKYEDLH